MRMQLLWLGPLLLLLVLAGCRPKEDGSIQYQTSAVVTGRFELFPFDQLQQTEQLVRVRVGHGPWVSWTALIAPIPGGGPVKYRLEHGSDPVYYVNDGYIYFIGMWGRGRTERLYASAQGTRFIVEERGDGPSAVDRVYLLGDFLGRVRVVPYETITLTSPEGDESQAVYLTKSRTYVRFGPNGTGISEPAPIPDPPDPIGVFVQNVEDTADAVYTD